jgi:hypothetical protein
VATTGFRADGLSDLRPQGASAAAPRGAPVPTVGARRQAAVRLPTVMVVGENRGLVSRVAWGLPPDVCGQHFIVGPATLGLLKLAPGCAGHIRIALDRHGGAAFRSATEALFDAGQTVIAMAADEAGIRFLSGTPIDGLIRAPHPDPSIVADFRDKGTFFGICTRLGIKTPNTEICQDKTAIDCRAVAEKFRYPLIVKPVAETRSRGVVLVRSEADLKAAIIDNAHWNFGPLLVQDFIDGADIHIGMFSVDGAILHQAVQMRNRNGITFLRNHALLEAARVLMRDCRFTGLADIDARLDRRGEVYVLECNPRPWGSMTAPSWCGLNFVRASIMFAIGRASGCPRSITDCSAPAPWRKIEAILRDPLTWNRLTADQKRTLGSAAWLAMFEVQDRLARMAGRRGPW